MRDLKIDCFGGHWIPYLKVSSEWKIIEKWGGRPCEEEDYRCHCLQQQTNGLLEHPEAEIYKDNSLL